MLHLLRIMLWETMYGVPAYFSNGISVYIFLFGVLFDIMSNLPHLSK